MRFKSSDKPWDPRATPTFWVNQASRYLVRRFEERLRPLDFGMAYLPVLVALEQNGALLQKQLAEQAHVGQPAMAALLGRMERDGLISRKPDPNDKRSSRIVLSAKARARVPKAKERLQEVADRAIAGFGEDERATLMALLRRIVHNLAEPVEEQTTREESTASPTVDRRPRKVRSS